MSMNLTDTQKQQVADWIRAGAQLPEVQKRIETEFGLRPTYMEVKFLVSDLQVLPKDADLPKTAPTIPVVSGPGPSTGPGMASATRRPPGLPAPEPDLEPSDSGGGAARVAISVDKVTRPGAMASGNATFSDGKSAAWYIDQYGRLGLAPKEKGYRPPAADVQEFQMLLEQELARQGY
jgi:hypothetical protein